MKYRILFAAALIAGTPFAARAQFTAVITPPKKEVATPVPQQTLQHRDSVQKVKLTDMKEWVDSAASALTAKSPSTTDTSKTVVAKPAPVVASHHHEPAASTKSAALPDTASPLPFLALLGLGMLSAGLFMLRKDRA